MFQVDKGLSCDSFAWLSVWIHLELIENPNSWTYPGMLFLEWIMWCLKTHPKSGHTFWTCKKEAFAFSLLALILTSEFVCSAAEQAFSGLKGYFLRTLMDTEDQLRSRVSDWTVIGFLDFPLGDSHYWNSWTTYSSIYNIYDLYIY